MTILIPIIAALTFAGFLGPFALAAQAYMVGSLGQALAYGGAGVVFLIGCLGVTLRLNFPIDDQAMRWQTAADAPGWQDVRRRFFALNAVRLAAAGAASVLVTYGALVSCRGMNRRRRGMNRREGDISPQRRQRIGRGGAGRSSLSRKPQPTSAGAPGAWYR